MQPLWDKLLGTSNHLERSEALQHLVSSAAATPLGKIGSFFKVARRHNQNVDPLSQLFVDNPQWLSPTISAASVAELAGFAHYAPPALIDILLTELKPGHWDTVPESRGLVGATWCGFRKF
jgi:hypothetical protein